MTFTASLLAASSLRAAGGIGNDLDVYFIGNSLTRGISLDRLAWLFTQRGGSLDYGSQLAAAAMLHEHWFQRRDSTNTPWSPNNIQSKPYGSYPQALGSNAFDAVIFQPYQYWLDTDADEYAANSNKIGDFQAISNFIRFARGENPAGNVGATNFFIYGTWPQLLGIHYRNTNTTPPNFATSYTGFTFAAFYAAPYTKAVLWGQPRQTVPTRDFCTQLVNRLNAAFPDLPRPVCLIPVGDVFAALDTAIRNDALPGLSNYLARNHAYYAIARKDDANFPIPTNTAFDARYGVVNFYCDQIHMNDQPHNGPEDGTIGAYVAALTIYTCLTGNNPIGLPATDGTNGWQRFHAVQDAALITALQSAVWNTVINDPLTGVVPEPAASVTAVIAAAAICCRRTTHRSESASHA